MAECIRLNEAKNYPAYTLHPYYHAEKMPWAAAIELPLDKIKKIIWVSGQTGRDPQADREPRSWQDERDGVGKVVGGIQEQTTACWMRIKEVLEAVGAELEDIFRINYYLVNREDTWDLWEATEKFWQEYCPDLRENYRAGVLLKGIQLDLPDMLIEIEVTAAVPKNRKCSETFRSS